MRLLPVFGMNFINFDSTGLQHSKCTLAAYHPHAQIITVRVATGLTWFSAAGTVGELGSSSSVRVCSGGVLLARRPLVQEARTGSGRKKTKKLFSLFCPPLLSHALQLLRRGSAGMDGSHLWSRLSEAPPRSRTLRRKMRSRAPRKRVDAAWASESIHWQCVARSVVTRLLSPPVEIGKLFLNLHYIT